MYKLSMAGRSSTTLHAPSGARKRSGSHATKYSYQPDDKPTLQEVLKELSSVKNKWHEISLCFGVDHNLLTSIRSKSKDDKKHLEEVLTTYMNDAAKPPTKPPTWATIIDLLKRSTDKSLTQHVAKIEKKFKDAKGVHGFGENSATIQVMRNDKQMLFHVRSITQGTTKLSIPFATFNEQQEICLNEEALDLLRAIKKPVAILTICGPYRSGKSYYLSRILGNSMVFQSSRDIDACTHGMWMATMILECKEFAIVLIDTEGTNSLDGRQKIIRNCIVLSSLLSSVLIYNSQGAPTLSDVEKMSFFAQLTENFEIRTGCSDTQECEFRECLPDFVWLMRNSDFELSRDESGEIITMTKHVTTKILQQSGVTSATPVSRTLLTLFKSFECLPIPAPIPGQDLASVPINKLRMDFNKGIEDSIKYIVSLICPRKGMDDKNELDGVLLAELAKNYVQELNKPNSIPNLEVSYESAVHAHIQEQANKLIIKYNEEMQSHITKSKVPFEEGDLESVPGPSENESSTTLFSIHHYLFKPKLKIFQQEIDKYMAGSSFSEAKKQHLVIFQERVIKHTNKKIEAGCSLHTHITTNREKSETFCQRIFDQQYEKVTNDVNIEALKESYLKLAKGPAKEEIWQSRLFEIPTSPKDFTELQVGVESVTVNWTDNEQKDVNYEIKIVCDDEKVSSTRSEKYDKPPAFVSNLTPNTCYHLHIRACGLRYKGMYSQPLIITTFAGKPSKPEKPKIEVKSPSTVKVTIKRLSYEDLHGAHYVDSVVLESAFKENMGWDQVTLAEKEKPHSIPITKCVILPSIPSDCDSVYYRVRMTTIGGESISDAEELPISEFIPGPPVNLKYSIPDNPEERKATISWDPPHNQRSIKFYDIQYQQEDGEWNPYKDCPDSKCTSILLTNLVPATNYLVKLKACNHASVHDECAFVSFKTEPTKPARPSMPKVHVDTENILQAHVYVTRLSKEDENGSPVSSVIVQKAVGEVSNWSDEKLCDFPKGVYDRPIKLRVNLFNATESKKHYFRVIMVNEAGKSEPSSFYEMESSQLIPGNPSKIWTDHITNNSITLKWDQPSCNPMSVDYYLVEMQEAGKEEWEISSDPRDIPRKKKMYTVRNLRQNCAYKFRVIAYNKDNQCARSSEESITPATTQPCCPTKPDIFAIRIETINSSSAKMLVKKPSVDETGSDITSVMVKRCDENRKPFSEEQINCEDCEGEVITKIIDINTQVCYLRICLINEHGMSPESDPVGVSGRDTTPGPPMLREVTNDDIDVRSITLTWNPPEERGYAAKQYQIETRSDECELWTTALCHYTVNECKHRGEISNLFPKTKYYFRVHALNGNLKSMPSKEISAETQAGRPNTPQPPRLIQRDGDPIKARVTFCRLEQSEENGSAVTGVKMEYNTDEELHWLQIGDIKKLNSEIPRQSSMFDIDLPNVKEEQIEWLSFRIKMINAVGESAPSQHVSINVSNLQPGMVDELQVEETAYHHVTLTWKTPKIHPAIIVNYIIEIQEIESGGWKDCIKLDPDKMKYQIKGLQCSHEYHLRISAASKSIRGPYQEIKIVTPDLPPEPPLHLRFDKKWSDAVKIRWGKPDRADLDTNDAYRISVKDKKGIKEIKRYYTRGYSKTIRGLNSYTTYKVEVAGVSKSMKFSTKNPSLNVTTAVSGTARVAWTVVGSLTLGPVGGIAAHQGLKSDAELHRIDSDTECEKEYAERCDKVYKQIRHKGKSRPTAQNGEMTEPQESTGKSIPSGASGSNTKRPARTTTVQTSRAEVQTTHYKKPTSEASKV